MKRLYFAVITSLLLASLVSPAIAQDSSAALGRIAYVGVDYNVYTLDPGEDNLLQLTDDAGQARHYLWPTWSTDGRLAYFSVSVEDQEYRTGAYISNDGLTQGREIYSGPEAFNYAYWSPGDCIASTGCRDLAVLLSSSTRGMLVELLRDGEVSGNIAAGTGGPPFYYSWSHDGSRMLWQRENNRFDIYNANADRVTDTLDQTPGAISAPAWSPVDDRLLVGASTDNDTTDLIILGDDSELLVLAEGLPGFVSYNWSPDGSLVAYREISSEGYGRLMVVDASTAEVVSNSFTPGVVSFFWSPDSARLAYVTLGTPAGGTEASSGNHLLAQGSQQPVGIRWSILTVDSSAVRQTGAFVPTSEMIYLLQYFDQFAQSHRVWSPDSRHLIYSELTPDGPIINVLDTSDGSSSPNAVAEGFIGIWSF